MQLNTNKLILKHLKQSFIIVLVLLLNTIYCFSQDMSNEKKYLLKKSSILQRTFINNKLLSNNIDKLFEIIAKDRTRSNSIDYNEQVNNLKLFFGSTIFFQYYFSDSFHIDRITIGDMILTQDNVPYLLCMNQYRNIGLLTYGNLENFGGVLGFQSLIKVNDNLYENYVYIYRKNILIDAIYYQDDNYSSKTSTIGFVDNDSDGIINYFDMCPNTTADSYCDINGCPKLNDVNNDDVIGLEEVIHSLKAVAGFK